MVLNLVESLAMPLENFRDLAVQLDHADNHNVNSAGPLVRAPIIEFEPGLYGSPSPDHITLQASPAALYLRLIRADSSDGGRERTKAAGEQFASYLRKWSIAELGPSWTVIDLDEYFDDDEHADILVISPSGKVAFLIEAKTTLQAANALMGDLKALSKMQELYQKARNQIDATHLLLAQHSDFAARIKNCECFGLIVSLDVHQHTMRGETLHVGMPLLWHPDPPGGVPGGKIRSRLLQADDYEFLVSVVHDMDGTALADYLRTVFKRSNTLRGPQQVALDSTLIDLDSEREVNDYARALFGQLTTIEGLGPAISAMLAAEDGA